VVQSEQKAWFKRWPPREGCIPLRVVSRQGTRGLKLNVMDKEKEGDQENLEKLLAGIG